MYTPNNMNTQECCRECYSHGSEKGWGEMCMKPSCECHKEDENKAC